MELNERDREMLDNETRLWCVSGILNHERQHAGAWENRIKALADESLAIAREMRDYNEQWLVDEDD